MGKGSFVDGKFVEGAEVLKTVSPANGQTIEEVFLADGKTIDKALAAAEKGIGKKPQRENFRILKEILSERSLEIAELIAIEQGKPVQEALAAEIYPSLSYLDFLLRKGEEIIGPKEVPPYETMFAAREGLLLHQATVVNLIVSPWNYPFAIPFLDIVASVFAGAPVIFRPSAKTPLVGLEIAKLFKDAGFPSYSLQVLITGHREVEEILKDPRIGGIFFTGSVETGRKIGELAGRLLKRAVLELGGKDAMVVFEDAPIERAVNGALWAGFMNAGQTCASVERLLLHKKIYREFLSRIKEKVEALRVGHPLEPETDMGPLISKEQREKVLRLIEEAQGKVVTGGRAMEGEGFFMEPTLVLEPPPSSTLWREEVFGPVIAVRSFETEEEAIALANDSKYGLTASVWTASRERARRVAEALQAGAVTVNDHLSSYAEPSAPWGGVKGSGLGRTHGEFALRDAVQIKYIMGDFSRRKKLLWWFPYSPKARKTLLLASQMLFGRGKLRAMLNLIPSIPRLVREVGPAALLSSLGKLIGL